MAFSEAVKLAVKRRTHFKCCICQRHSVSLEVHHITPQADGGSDDEDNGAPLCPTCHEEYGANPLKRTAIRVQRDFWYEICERRYSSDAGQLDQIIAKLEDLTREVVAGSRQEASSSDPRRNREQVESEIVGLLERLGYEQFTGMKRLFGEMPSGTGYVPLPQDEARAISERHGLSVEGLSDYDLATIYGKLSALRWVLGEDWDLREYR